MKKFLSILLVLTVLCGQVALADIATPDEIKIIEEAPISRPSLGDFKNPTSIYLISKDGNSRRVDTEFKEGLRVSSDRTAVGVRDFTNLFPYMTVDWDVINRLVIVSSQDKKLILPIDRKIILVNGIKKEIDVPATIDPEIGRTFLPLRSLTEELGFGVGYQEESRTILITEPGFVYEGKQDPNAITKEDIFGPVADLLKSGQLDPDTLIRIDRSNLGKKNSQPSPQQNSDKGSSDNKPLNPPQGMVNPLKSIRLVEKNVRLTSGTRSISYAEEMAGDLLDIMNRERRSNHLPNLKSNNSGQNYADIRSAELIENLSNTRPDGSDFSDNKNIFGELILKTNARDADGIFDSIYKNKNLLEAINSKEVNEVSISIAHQNNISYLIIHMYQ